MMKKLLFICLLLACSTVICKQNSLLDALKKNAPRFKSNESILDHLNSKIDPNENFFQPNIQSNDVQIKGNTLILGPGDIVQVGSENIEYNKLANIVAFNQILVQKCGVNFEKCMSQSGKKVFNGESEVESTKKPSDLNEEEIQHSFESLIM